MKWSNGYRPGSLPGCSGSTPPHRSSHNKQTVGSHCRTQPVDSACCRPGIQKSEFSILWMNGRITHHGVAIANSLYILWFPSEINQHLLMIYTCFPPMDQNFLGVLENLWKSYDVGTSRSWCPYRESRIRPSRQRWRLANKQSAIPRRRGTQKTRIIWTTSMLPSLMQGEYLAPTCMRSSSLGPSHMLSLSIRDIFFLARDVISTCNISSGS